MITLKNLRNNKRARMKNKNKQKKQLCKQNLSQQQKNNINKDLQINFASRSVVESIKNIEQQQQNQK